MIKKTTITIKDWRKNAKTRQNVMNWKNLPKVILVELILGLFLFGTVQSLLKTIFGQKPLIFIYLSVLFYGPEIELIKQRCLALHSFQFSLWQFLHTEKDCRTVLHQSLIIMMSTWCLHFKTKIPHPRPVAPSKEFMESLQELLY